MGGKLFAPVGEARSPGFAHVGASAGPAFGAHVPPVEQCAWRVVAPLKAAPRLIILGKIAPTIGESKGGDPAKIIDRSWDIEPKPRDAKLKVCHGRDGKLRQRQANLTCAAGEGREERLRVSRLCAGSQERCDLSARDLSPC